MAKLNSLKDLFVDQLKVLYYSEKEFLNIVSKAIDVVHSEDLKGFIENHKKEARKQIKRLEQVFDHLQVKAVAENCPAMNGIVDEIEEALNEDADPTVIDAAVIAEIQKGIHFKIACYGTLKTYAGILGHEDIANRMLETLSEEKNSDKSFTKIAQEVNQEAV